MNIHYSEQQAKAIKILFYNQNLDNERIQRLKDLLRKADTSNMTLEEAHRIIGKMPQAKKDAVNEILIGKVQPLPRYSMKEGGKVIEQAMKKILYFSLFFIIVVALLSGHTYIGAGIFLCWLVYIAYILSRWIKVEILHFIRNKDSKAPIKEK